MKVLVTGGAGFIGSHIADALLARGHEVVIIDNLVTGRKENLNPQARFHQVDIRDREIAAIFRREQFEVVYHQAAQMDVRKSVADPRYDAEVNILGTLNLLQQAQQTGVKKFIFASTGGAIYGEQVHFPADEEHPTWPASPYGITKLACEKYIAFFGQSYGLSYVLLRYANVYGPRQSPHGEAGVVAIFTARLLSGEQAVINGDGRQTRDYVYVGDVVAANLAALDYPVSDYFNIGTGRETDVNQLFRLLNQATGSRCEERHGPAKPGEQRRSVLSYEKAARLLGWRPQVNLEQGLEQTVAWFKNKR
ncbi:MAG: SDR family oxidoreductase [candidate division KSB1 bacterium]|nr:SDR family oxidoreductase [candidate division KSB1 bacterium]MDZ7273492.1 SDR family oxidoreductase [candidate division KSB1 bacterium]MDZ7286916.1 SDR family oxidoreductase [candidate division KSB1 bacterium]MDZ7299731.1 SDR family oxidoreductase [candidate division KSB1 bacterium]MDZ7305670.1 SDR family oxidoreductase [candidate division KSB1 bacterium]